MGAVGWASRQSGGRESCFGSETRERLSDGQKLRPARDSSSEGLNVRFGKESCMEEGALFVSSVVLNVDWGTGSGVSSFHRDNGQRLKHSQHTCPYLPVGESCRN